MLFRSQKAAAEIAKQTHTEHAAPKPAGPPKAQMPSLLDFVESCTPTDDEVALARAAYDATAAVQRPAAPPPTEVTIPGQERLGTVPAPDPAFLDSIPDKARKEVYVHRCTNLTRDVLPKAGAKNAGALLLAFLLKDTGKPTWNELTIREWNTALEKIEAVKTPQAILKLLKSA